MTTRDLLIAKLENATPDLAARWAPVYAQLGWTWGDGIIPTAADIERALRSLIKLLALDSSRHVVEASGLRVELYDDAGSATITFLDEWVVTDVQT
jgi:hypothetical protein